MPIKFLLDLQKPVWVNYVLLLGILKLVSLLLFIYPKTHKVGFLFLCCYLGGALSIELAGGEPPVSSMLLVVIWVSVYLKDKLMFVETPVAV